MLALDARLAGVVRGAREPMLAQLRLAWWRDRLRDDPARWPKGEPLLAALEPWGAQAQHLVALVDGWEALLEEAPLASEGFASFAEGRRAAVAALARLHESADGLADEAGRQWGLADLALHLGDPVERETGRALIGDVRLPVLPRPMRPLAIIAGLSLRAVRRGRMDPLDGPGALLAAIRLGLIAR